MCVDFSPLLPERFAAPLGAASALEDQMRRTRQVLDTYGVVDRSVFPDLIVGRFGSKVERVRISAATDPLFARLSSENEVFFVETLAYVEAIRDHLEEALR